MALMKNKPVAFNLESEADQELLEYVSKLPNFSGYIKQLILADKRKKPTVYKTEGGGINIKLT